MLENPKYYRKYREQYQHVTLYFRKEIQEGLNAFSNFQLMYRFASCENQFKSKIYYSLYTKTFYWSLKRYN